jgi:acyl-coenzyme A thioesterase PaaI-like protein
MAAGDRHAAPLAHHDLCFGCGQANLFGLQLEARPEEDGAVVGRLFLKQDHQGPRQVAHGGIVAAALDETMSFAAARAAGDDVMTARIEVDYREPAPIATFLRVEARVERREDDSVETTARARTVGEGAQTVAEGRATFVPA